MIQVNDEQLAHLIADLGQRVLSGGAVDRAEAEQLTRVTGDLTYDLFYWANRIRIRYVGRSIKFCSIVAGKVGACKEDCGYCSQSKHYDTGTKPSRLTVDEMIEATDEALGSGASSFGIVNSGRGPTERELDWLEEYFERTAGEGKIRPCATLGELTPEQAKRLKAMGVQRINHNLETSQRHFPNVISTHTYEDRVRTIRVAKEAGLSICSGGIFGLGETWEDRLDMIFALREIEPDVVPINFLNPIHGTPMHGRVDPMAPMEALKVIAICRFLLPQQELKLAGGREKILRDLQSWAFYAGASSFLIGNYLTTTGRSPEEDHQMLRDLGLPYTTFDEVEHEASPESLGQETGRVRLPVIS